MGRPPKSLRKNSIHSIAIKLLTDSKKPMTVKEIKKVVLEKKSLTTKTPSNTINSILQRSDFVKRIGKGTFVLK
jgi:hypothetical protein